MSQYSFLRLQETIEQLAFKPELHKRPSPFSFTFSTSVRAGHFAVGRITRGNAQHTIIKGAILQQTDPACAHGCPRTERVPASGHPSENFESCSIKFSRGMKRRSKATSAADRRATSARRVFRISCQRNHQPRPVASPRTLSLPFFLLTCLPFLHLSPYTASICTGASRFIMA